MRFSDQAMLSFSPPRRRHRAGAAPGIECSGGSRLASDADRKIRAGIEEFGQSTEWALELAREMEPGAAFPELIR